MSEIRRSNADSKAAFAVKSFATLPNAMSLPTIASFR
jgi:hypothetical protein